MEKVAGGQGLPSSHMNSIKFSDLKMLPFPECIKYAETLQITNYDLFFSFLDIILWLHIVLRVTTSCDPLLQKASCVSNIWKKLYNTSGSWKCGLDSSKSPLIFVC